MASSKHHAYDPVSPTAFEEKDTETPYSDQNSEDEPFIESRLSKRGSRLRTQLPWLLCAFFATTTAVLAVLLIQYRRMDSSRPDKYEFRKFYEIHMQISVKLTCDLVDPNSIPLVDIKFTGSPLFDANGVMQHKPYDKNTPWPENVPYFGQPSPEIDDNWQRLIGSRYFSLSEEEAKRVWPDKYKDYVDELEGGYTAG